MADEHEQNLAYQKVRDEMYYRERAVDHALELHKQNKAAPWSAEELIYYANAIYRFYKGTSNE